MFYYMYQITNKVNNKIYVGVHKTKSLDDGYMGSGKVIKSAIEKHGILNFEKVILEHFENQEAMYAREKEVVNEEFLLREDVYNLRCGGYGGFDHITKMPEYKINCAKGGRTSGLVNNFTKNPEWHLKASSEGGKVSGKINVIKAAALSHTDSANAKRKATMAASGHSKGEKNSQAGTMWITDGTLSLKIKKTDEIPFGFFKGRKIKQN